MFAIRHLSFDDLDLQEDLLGATMRPAQQQLGFLLFLYKKPSSCWNDCSAEFQGHGIININVPPDWTMICISWPWIYQWEIILCQRSLLILDLWVWGCLSFCRLSSVTIVNCGQKVQARHGYYDILMVVDIGLSEWLSRMTLKGSIQGHKSENSPLRLKGYF